MQVFNPQLFKFLLKNLKTKYRPVNPIEARKSKSNGLNLVVNSERKIPAKTLKVQQDLNLKENSLNRNEQALLMKELLKVPGDLKQLLAQLLYQKNSAEALMKLMQNKGQKVEIDLLKQLLEGNSKDVIGKLIKMLQYSTEKTQNYEQLKQLINLLSQSVPQKNSTPQEVLMHLIILYLPWLPLAEQQNIKVEFEKKKSGGAAGDRIALVLYVSTVNLGRFKVSIILTKENAVESEIENVREYREQDEEGKEGEEQEKKVLKALLKFIRVEVKDSEVESKTNMKVKRQKNYKETPQRGVTVSKVTSISPLVIITAQKIAKAILEFDDKLSLLEKRGETVSQES